MHLPPDTKTASVSIISATTFLWSLAHSLPPLWRGTDTYHDTVMSKRLKALGLNRDIKGKIVALKAGENKGIMFALKKSC